MTTDWSSMSAVKLALLADQTRSQTSDGDALAAEPIAIIGLGCRFPGGANTPEAYWDLLSSRTDAITEVPPDRWDADEFYDVDGTVAGKMNTRWGGFVDGIDQFDAPYFGISPREASHMDPQQRMFMEVAVEALERAGQPIDALAGTLTGVFVGSSMLDYGEREHAGAHDIDAYSITGNVHCIIPNRFSYTFDLRGPSVSVDTACSSSLVAVHLACQSLRNGDSDLAVAGGVNALLSPNPTVGLAKWNLMAPDGRCKTLDASADGFVRSEGCGVVTLKRLADAIADNDPVLAVIRGSAVNQDGRSTAMTAPNGLAQQDVMRHALRTARVLPEQVGMVEMHGTGTVLGDPIEVEAIADVLGAGGPDVQPLALGAAKTNIGHLEAASGIAGLIKTVLCLRNGAVPPPVHFERLNPHISLDDSRLFVPTETHPWPRTETRRIAAVSAFGFGGTNAHALVEEAPRLPPPPERTGLPLLLLSAQTPDALRATASAVADRLTDDLTARSGDGGDESQSIGFADVTATAARRATHHAERMGVVAADRDDAIERLRMYTDDERSPTLVTGRAEATQRRRVAFICSGQGNQWCGMARDLLTDYETFRSVIERCDELMRQHVSWSLLDELNATDQESRLERTEFAQPTIFAIQVGLAELLRSWGVEPHGVVGHSVGEVAAAHIAGVLDLADAVRVITARGNAMAGTAGTGAMASVELDAAAVLDAIEPHGDAVSIAATNAPDVTVIAGRADVVTEVSETLRRDGIVVRTLDVTYPFHSALMAPCGDEVERALHGLSPAAPSMRFVSTVTGALLTDTPLDATYWSRNVREAVRFADAITAIAAQGCDTFVELGPHPVLGGAIARTLATADGSSDDRVITATLRRGRPGLETVAAAVGELHCNGVEIDLAAVWPGRHRIADLPTYRWQHRRHWVDNWQAAGGSASATVSPATGRDVSSNPLVGRRLRSPAIEGAVYESWPTPEALAVLDDHRVAGTSIMPGTGFIEMMLGATTETGRHAAGTVEQIDLLAALALNEDGVAPSVQIHVTGRDAHSSQVTVSSSDDGERWTEHARGRVSPGGPAPLDISLDAIRDRCTDRLDGAALYATLLDRDIEFGPSYLAVQELWLGRSEALSRIETPSEVAATAASHVVHPALLDAASHSLTALLPDEAATFLPIAIDTLHLHGAFTNEIWSHVRLREPDGESADLVTADVVITDGEGRVVADVIGLRVARVDATAVARTRDAPRDQGETDEHLFAVDWRDDSVELGPAPEGPWLIVADRRGIADQIARMLRADGASVETVGPDDVLDAATVRSRIASTGVSEVVYLRGLDTPKLESGSGAVDDQRVGLGGALSALQGSDGARIWLVTRGATDADGAPSAPEQATLCGAAAGFRAERPDTACISVDLDPAGSVEDAASSLRHALGTSSSDVIALRGDRRLTPTLVPVDTVRVGDVRGPTRLASSSYGVLDGLHDRPMERIAPAPGEVEVEVEVTGLNFRDVLVALDMYPQPSDVFGDECVGTIVRVGDGVEPGRIGDAVVALAPGAFASHVVTNADLTHPLPANLDVEDAATIPMTFLTAHYALVSLGRMQRGERVLVHAGAGGVGMAAIQLAQAAGAEVFATAGSDDKRATLRSLGVHHVFDSRSLDFADGVMAATGGDGVDLVLNSLADEFIARSVDVTARDGRFLEIGRRDVWSHERMSATRADIDYHIVFLGDLSLNDPPAIQEMLRELIPRFESDELRPLPRTTYPGDEVVDAFRLMAQARHTGKVVIRRSRATRPEGTQLITGGTGGIGIEIARHLVEGGARSIALTSRSGPGDRAAAAIDRWRGDGVDVAVFAADVADRAALAQVIDAVDADMAPLGGIVHAAGVTDDALVTDQTWPHFERALAPKLAGATNLIELTEGRDLEMLILMSAASPVIGAPGQTNYVAANAALDSLAATHHTDARPVLSIGWGAWDRVGMTADLDDASLQRMRRRGLRPMSAARALAAFDAACELATRGSAHVLAVDLDRSDLDERSLFDELRDGETAAAEDVALLARWADTVPGMRRGVISTFVTERARKVLGLSSSTPIPMRQPLSELGLDSLMAVELRNAIGTALGEAQPATLLFDHPTSAALVDHLLGLADQHSDDSQGSGKPAEVDPMNHAAPAIDVDDLADLSDAEVEALLLAELGDPVVDE